jgi:hypothetical protein
MRDNWLKYILISLIVLGVVISLYIGYERNLVEKENNQIEIAVEWSQVKEWAGRENISVKDVLNKLESSVTGIVFKEDTINDLKSNKQVIIKSGIELYWDLKVTAGGQNQNIQDIHFDWNYFVFNNREDMDRVSRNLSLKGLHKKEVVTYDLPTSQGILPVLGTPMSLRDIANIGVGFCRDELILAESLKFDIIPQIRAWRNVNQESLDIVFGQFKGLPVTALFFNDVDIPGVDLTGDKQDEAYRLLAEEITKMNAPLGMIEFFPQKGIKSVAELVDHNIVRMHAIPLNEMSSMTQSRAVDRFTLAVKDRDIRVLMVRFLPEMELYDNINFLKDISTSLENEGFTLGTPQAFKSLHFSWIYLLLISLAAASGTVLLFVNLGYHRLGLVIGVLGLLGSMGLIYLGKINLAQKGLALTSVIIFPVLSISLHISQKPASLLKSLVLFIRMTFVSLIGAVLMVGLLADNSYMYTLDQFMGVKLAHLIPILLVILIFWFFRDDMKKSISKINMVLNYQVTVKYLCLLAFIGVILLVYIMRTGNEGASVSTWELMLRGKLENLLSVRPRTKEFLIGHPLMLLMLYLGYRDRYLPILLLGTIGQVSIVNTFAHIHTPLVISLMRTLNGVWLGLIIGMVLIWVYNFIKQLMRNRQQKTYI